MKKQAFNPFLPSYEYIPDGEPHVFGDRIYVFGSHDRFNGRLFCLNDYVCWSAPVDDLSAWSYAGVIYQKRQDRKDIRASAPLPKRGMECLPSISATEAQAIWISCHLILDKLLP